MRPFTSSRFRLSSVALAAALLFALGGLFAIDRMLSQSSRGHTQIEAAQYAALIEGFMAAHVEALQSVRGLYLDTARTVSDADFRMLSRAISQYTTSFSRIWVTDSAGMIRHEFVMEDSAGPLPAGLDIDTVHQLHIDAAATRARLARHVQVSAIGPLFSGTRGFVMLEPLYVGNRFMGFAGESIEADALLQSVQERHPIGQGAVALLAGADTIARNGRPQPERPFHYAYAATVKLDIPGSAEWRILVVRPAGTDLAHIVLWGVGLATLGALVIALFHERRQGLRLAERSAELERLSGELLRANRAKSEFLANVSHELRTPLNAIVGFIDLLRDGVYGELAPRQIGPVERITSSADHLRHLVDQVLDIAKMAAGRFDVHVEMIDLHPFILTVASEVEALANERGLNLSITVSPALPRVRTDPINLRQILINLLGNAIKFTTTGGIAVRARLVNQRDELVRTWNTDWRTSENWKGDTEKLWIALQVADSGIGIAPGDRNRIFEEFEQVDAGPRGESMERGTGLGLAISRRLARLMGGDLTVESEVGKGSTFTVWLPVDRADVRPSASGATRDSELGVRD